MAQDAILKDDKEREAEEEVKHIDVAAETKLLEKLAEHEQKQKKLLEEQQQIRKELEENKKESINAQVNKILNFLLGSLLNINQLQEKNLNKQETSNEQKVAEKKELKVVPQDSDKKLPSLEAAVSNNVNKDEQPKADQAQEKKAEESQNIGELVNGLQKLTKELKGLKIVNVKLTLFKIF